MDETFAHNQTTTLWMLGMKDRFYVYYFFKLKK